MKLCVHALEVSRGAHLLCRALAFDLSGGERLAILGRNGAGKSTLLLTLAGLRAPQGGSISIDGTPLAQIGSRQLALLRGYCPQQQADPFASTVLETALIGRHPHLDRWDWESRADAELARAALAEVGLAGFAERSVFSLSGGERQRLALAAQLVQAPALYLLDEPLTHLDLNHAISMLELFERRTREQGAALVAVMHDPNLARRYFQRALLLFDDGAWIEGRSEEVLNTDNLSRLYGHPLQALTVDGQPWFVPHRSSHE